MSLRFGACAFDMERHLLFRGGKAAHLTPKAYQLLELLVQRRPAAVSKAEIHEKLWPRTFVSEISLVKLVFEIRRAVGDDPRRARCVRTVRGFGYAFCAEARETGPARSGRPQAPERCRLIWGDQEIALDEGENVLGRVPEAVAWIDHPSVSRRHARVLLEGERAWLEDLGSKNGTFVAERRIRNRVLLEDGSRIRLGTVPLTFRIHRVTGTTDTAVPSK